MTYTPVDYNTYDFANRRHIGPSPEEMAEMLRVGNQHGDASATACAAARRSWLPAHTAASHSTNAPHTAAAPRRHFTSPTAFQTSLCPDKQKNTSHNFPLYLPHRFFMPTSGYSRCLSRHFLVRWSYNRACAPKNFPNKKFCGTQARERNM